MNAIMMDVGIQTQCDKNVAIQKPGHESSPSASIWRTVSAVIGRRPREMTKPLRFIIFPPLGVLLSPDSERLNNRLTASLMLQSSAFARDFATAYRSGSRLTVSLMDQLWCSGALVSNPVEDALSPW